MSSAPLISVLLPVYNGEPYLRAAIDSVLAQSLGDFELLVINDGSTDRTQDIIEALRDDRIRPYTNARRQGLPATLDRGLTLARGRYLARMDADDLCAVDRFRLQARYLEQHPETSLVGSWYRLMGSNRIVPLPESSAEISFHLMRFNCIAHPSVMFRLADFRANGLAYDAGYEHAEDYACWVRFARLGLRMVNLPLPLLVHRRHSGQISRRHAAAQRRATERIALEQLAYIGLEPSPDDLRTHFSLLRGEFVPDSEYVESAARWIETLLAANKARGFYDDAVMGTYLAERWFRLSYHATAAGPAAWRRYRSAGFARHFRPPAVDLLKLAVRSFLGLGSETPAACTSADQAPGG